MTKQIDHKTFLSGFDAPMRAALTARRDGPALRHLAAHAGLIVVCATAISLRVPLWWVLLPIQGVLISFLFTLAHECTHKTPFANERLNDAVGHICGVLLVLPFRTFRYFHLAHHKWTNIQGRDPELDGAPIDTPLRWSWHITGLPYWRSQFTQIANLVTGHFTAPWLPDTARAAAIRDARLFALLYAFAALSLLATPLLFWVWILPAMLGQPALRLYLLAEHGDCPKIANMFENTRTTYTNRMVRFLAWNMPYHIEHHVWPQVPFHQLPALHAHAKAHLGVTSKGYAAFTKAYLARRST
jgi:fatty acid desaturase